ncbi:MAG TPA: hypothetical protein DCP92_14650 [Nitrospiraceae bacterium]|nr:hypothetical protein [Nitrospiraceae bacterium]
MWRFEDTSRLKHPVKISGPNKFIQTLSERRKLLDGCPAPIEERLTWPVRAVPSGGGGLTATSSQILGHFLKGDI